MHYLINIQKKIIFGCSPKCGCTHVKNIWAYLNDLIKKPSAVANNIHNNGILNTFKINKKNLNSMNINSYTVIIFIRNPYKRVVSGFLNKYKKNGQYRHMWKHTTITFSMFVNEIIKDNWEMIDKHHFVPQTRGEYTDHIMTSNNVIFYDITNIDYKYLGELFNKNIPEWVIKNTRGNHNRSKFEKNDHDNTYVYDLPMKQYIDNKVETKFFYNEDIKNKIFKFYNKDFLLFKKYGFDYSEY